MTFVQLEFLPFLAVVLALYWGSGSRRLQNGVLVAAGAVFYGWVHPAFLALLYAVAAFDYTVARLIESSRSTARLWVALSVLGNLGLLGYFKYFDFFVENVAAALAALGVRTNLTAVGIVTPIGLSFYTFQSMSYTIDVYRRVTHARKDLLDYLVYVSFFPQLVAGPIERAGHFLVQVERERRFELDRFWSGVLLAAWGAFKKVAIADLLAPYVDKSFVLVDPPAAIVWTSTLAFVAQLYADFSGYTDLARGTARMLGFDLAKNFDRPLLATSAPDFWRRWHISLSEWIRDYVLVPLMGTGTGYPRFVAATLVTFLLVGLWHGASWNFVLLGLYQGVWVVAYATLSRLVPGWESVRWARPFYAAFYFVVVDLVCSLMFREHHLGRLYAALTTPFFGATHDERVVALVILSTTAVFGLPLVLQDLVGPRVVAFVERSRWRLAFETTFLTACLTAMFVLRQVATYSFIYFQF